MSLRYIRKYQSGDSLSEDTDKKNSAKKSEENVNAPVISENAQQLMSGINSVANPIFDTTLNMMGKQQNDIIDQGVAAAGNFAKQFGFWGEVASLGVNTLNTIDKALGPKIGNFDGATGVAGYANQSVNGDNFRLTQMASANRLRDERSDAMQKFSNAMVNVDAGKQWAAASAQSADNMLSNRLNSQNGGYSAEILTAKRGATLRKIKSISERVDRKKKQKNKSKKENVQQYYAGGAVIPSGALHKNKHHIEDFKEELDGNITKKGIPVITIEEGGEIVQHAEIEKEEIILPLSLTKQLEKLWKEGTDESAIEAGKLFTQALLTDTEDNVGLIEKIENEG